jgi:hypothetical protein
MISNGISETGYVINASSMGKIMRYLFSYLKLNHFSCFKNYYSKRWFLLFDYVNFEQMMDFKRLNHQCFYMGKIRPYLFYTQNEIISQVDIFKEWLT